VAPAVFGPPAPARQDDVVLGAVVIVVILVLFPVAVFVSGGIASGILGFFLKEEAEAKGDPVWRELNR
jgi:hypothetical protein